MHDGAGKRGLRQSRLWTARHSRGWMARQRRHAIASARAQLRGSGHRRPALTLLIVLVAAELTAAAVGYVSAAEEASPARSSVTREVFLAQGLAGAGGAQDAARSRSEVFVPDDRMVEAGELPARGMSYEAYAGNAREIIAALPTLEVLSRHFPASPMTRSIGAQKAHIAALDAQAQVSVEGFADLTIDMSRRRAFVEQRWYHRQIRPKLFVVHWTGMGYRDVDHFVTSLKPFRVQFFMDRDANVYQLFESDRQLPAHAKGANEFAQGVEIETGPFDGVTSPLFSYTPAQIEQTVYLAVAFLRRNDLPVDETTLIGHFAADLIFTNPYYDPRAARFSRASIRKFDPPQELMEVIVRKAHALDAALDAADQTAIEAIGSG